jgi:four helix bundle protein
MSKVGSFKELILYQKAYKSAMKVFEFSRGFPKEETYSLTDQIRRSSRSVTSCIAESWAKRKYEKAFVSKLSDALGVEYETEGWLDYSYDCKYISGETHERITAGYEEVRRILISMINKPDQWCT